MFALFLTLSVFTSLASANTQTLSLAGTVNNLVPTLSANAVSPASPAPTAGTTTAVTVSVTVTDNNGYQDITTSPGHAYFKVKDPSAAQYFPASGTQDLTCSGGSGVSITCTYTFNMNYYDASGTYTIYFDSTDVNSGAATEITQTFTYAASKLLGALSPSTATFAATNPGATSAAVTIAVANGGNTATGVCASMSSDLTGGSPSGTITKGNVASSKNSDMTSSISMTTSSTAIPSLSIAGTNGASGNTYWTLTVPTGTPAGSYTGSAALASC
ncbi:MAG: hypothetical protein ACYDCK_08860 [Thermoplasmatota archaeon]